MTTGERIAARRDELGLKQYQVAEQIGVTKTTMSKYENNVNIPNADILPCSGPLRIISAA